ncbi:HEAT repeat domain-containing protein [Candidatus Uabimicrobium sp. HlEnr_7]|uniref:HEAT repeat domain-containing protein n=1 Tax=Candidatus Uabimicrobium helgolandensis TaxID=3095367 RepID=UPI003555EFE3
MKKWLFIIVIVIAIIFSILAWKNYQVKQYIQKLELQADQKLKNGEYLSSLKLQILAIENGGDNNIKVRRLLEHIKSNFPQRTIEFSKEAYKSKDSFVRSEAINILWQVDDKRALPILLNALEDPDKDIQAPLQKIGMLGLKASNAVPHLINIITNPKKDKHLRIMAIQELPRIANEQQTAQIVKVYLRCLKDTDSYIQDSALSSLGNFEHTAHQAVPDLITFIKSNKNNNSTSLSLKVRACQTLGEIGDTAAPAIPLILEILQITNDHHQRLRLIEALGRIGTKAKQAVPQIIPLLGSREDTYVRIALENIGIDIEYIDDLIKYKQYAPIYYNEKYLPAIAKNLENSRQEIRLHACELLTRLCSNKLLYVHKFATKSVKTSLLSMLNNDDKIVGDILWILADLKYTDTKILFERFVKHKSYKIKIPAAYGLVISGEKQHVDILLSAINHQQKSVRENVYKALHHIRQRGLFRNQKLAKSIASPLLQKLKNTNKIDHLTVRMLCEVGEGLPYLLEIFSNCSDRSQNTIAYSLPRFVQYDIVTDFALEFLSKTEGFTQSCIIKTLGTIRAQAKQSVPQLIKLINQDTNSEEAIYALGKIGQIQAISPLLKNLEDRNNRFQENIYIALGDIGKQPELVVPILLNKWQELQQTRMLLVPQKMSIAYALIRYGKPEIGQPYIIKNLKSQSSFRRNYALRILEQLGKRAFFAKPLLEKLNSSMRNHFRIQSILETIEE